MKIAAIICLLVLSSLQLLSQSERDSSKHEGPVAMTVEQFKAKTSVTNKLVLVNFKADWCIVCKKMKPVLDQVKAENKNDVEVLIIDMASNPRIAEHFEVDGLPITLIYKNGVMVWDRMGLLNRDELTGILKSFK